MEILAPIIEKIFSLLDILGQDINIIFVHEKIPLPKYIVIISLVILCYLLIKFFSRIVRSCNVNISRLERQEGTGSLVQGLTSDSRFVSSQTNVSRALATHEEFSKVKEEITNQKIVDPAKRLDFKRSFFNVLRLLSIALFIFVFFIFPWTLGEFLSASSKMAYSGVCLLISFLILWWGGDFGKY